MGNQMQRPPKIFHVNWFRTDEDGDFMWPGFGENLRILEWILDRCREEADAEATPIGFVPTKESLDLSGLDLPDKTVEKLLKVDPDTYLCEVQDIRQFFEKFGDRLPHALVDEADALERRLQSEKANT
jgi:phosphoenolpyruvate carboxykinase (GTP)